MPLTSDYTKQALIRNGIDPDTGKSLSPMMSQQPQLPQQNQMGLGDMAKQMGLGAGQALTTNLVDVANLARPALSAIPKMMGMPTRELPQIQQPQEWGEGGAYDVGKFLGNAASLIGGGEAAETARGASEALPYIGKAAEYLGQKGLGGVLKRVGGTATYGAITNPEDRLKGAEAGAIAGTIGEAIPATLGGVKSLVTKAKAQTLADTLMDGLSGGRSLNENSQSLAADIKNSYEKNLETNKGIYKPVHDQFGDQSIYSAGDISPKYPVPDVLDSYNPDLKDLHAKFAENPTFDNAHNLQSQLGAEIRKFEKSEAKGTLTPEGTDRMLNYRKGRNALQDDMYSFLQKADPSGSSAAQYSIASQDFLENVAPYRTNPTIAKIANGDVTNPKNVTNLFSYPEEDTQKIIEDIGPQANNKILYSELGKISNKTPENIQSGISALDKKGLSSYMTPELQSLSNTLGGRIKTRATLQQLAGLAGGAAYGHPLIGFVAGTFGGPALKKLGESSVVQNLGRTLGSIGDYGYSPLKKAIIANYLNSQGK